MIGIQEMFLSSVTYGMCKSTFPVLLRYPCIEFPSQLYARPFHCTSFYTFSHGTLKHFWNSTNFDSKIWCKNTGICVDVVVFYYYLTLCLKKGEGVFIRAGAFNCKLLSSSFLLVNLAEVLLKLGLPEISLKFKEDNILYPVWIFIKSLLCNILSTLPRFCFIG